MIHQKISENQDNLKHLKVIKLLLKKEQQRSNKKTEQSKKRRKNLSKQLNLNTNKSFLQLSFRISYRNNSINLQNNNRIKKMRNTIENIVLGQKLAEIGQIQKTERTKNKQNIAKNISKDHRTERKSIKNGNLSTKKQLKISQGYKKYRDYRYYISQIEQYMQRVKQQNANIFIDHLLLAMYQYKSYRYVIMPENPMQSINVDLNEKYFQYTHAPYERSLLLSKTACGVRLNSRLTRTKKRNQENQTNKSVNSSLNKEFTRRNCDNLPINTTNPNKFIKLNRNILLFDLDQTLIHSLTKLDQHSHPGQQIYPQMDNSHPKLEQCEIYITKNQMKTEKMNKIDQDSNHFEEFQEKINKINICSNLKNRTWGKPQGIFVNIRPHAKQMLRRLSDHFIMGIFTAAQQTYANQILKILDPSSKIFSIKLFRQHCINLSSLSFISPNTLSSTTFSENVKDLRILSYDNCRLSASNVILVDNSPLSYLFQPDNGVPIIPFTNNPLDNQLLRLERFLYENLRDCADVRDIISNWFGTKYYQNFKSIREIVDKIYNNVQKNQF